MRVDPAKNFGTRECPGCATEVEANNNRCPICSYEFPNPPAPRRLFRIIASLALALVLAAILYALLFPR